MPCTPDQLTERRDALLARALAVAEVVDDLRHARHALGWEAEGAARGGGG
jgi:hypothetical protein